MSNTQGEHREASEHTFSPVCVCARGCVTFAVCFSCVFRIHTEGSSTHKLWQSLFRMYPVGIINPSLISMGVYQLGGAPCPTAGGGGVNAVSVSDNKLHKVYFNGGRTSTPLCFSLTEDQCYTFCSCCSLVYASSMRFSVFINEKKNRYFFKNCCQTKTNKHFLSPLFSRSDTMSARGWILII